MTTERRRHHACRHQAGAPRGGRAFRPPDTPVEPEDASLPLRGAFRDLHHRPREVPVRPRGDLRVRAEPGPSSRHRPVRRDEEAGPGGRAGAVRPRGHALREPPLARRHAHELHHGVQAPAAPSRTARDGSHRCARLPAEEGSDPPAPRARQAPAQPRRHPGPRAASRRDLRDRHEEGAHRRQRGPQAEHPRDRHRRHELRSRRGRLRDPGQRRRHPRREPGHPCRRRRAGRRLRHGEGRGRRAGYRRCAQGHRPQGHRRASARGRARDAQRRGRRGHRRLHGLRAGRAFGCRNGRGSG